MKYVLTALLFAPGVVWAHGESGSMIHYLTHAEHWVGLVAVVIGAFLFFKALRRIDRSVQPVEHRRL